MEKMSLEIKNEMHLWFIYLFEQRMDKKGFVKCFECGKKMSEKTWKNLSTCYSHILSKKTYPELRGDENNIVIVHPDCHHLYTVNPKAAQNQYNKYLELKEQITKK